MLKLEKKLLIPGLYDKETMHCVPPAQGDRSLPCKDPARRLPDWALLTRQLEQRGYLSYSL